MAEEEGAGKTGGAETTVAWRRSFCDGGGSCSLKGLLSGADGTAWLHPPPPCR